MVTTVSSSLASPEVQKGLRNNRQTVAKLSRRQKRRAPPKWGLSHNQLKSQGVKVVGATGFEPATPNPPENWIWLNH
jgi:hypothetical protein